MVNINGKEWRVVLGSPLHPLLEMPDGNYAIGVCDDPSKTIVVCENLNSFYLKKVLCHELAHAAMFSYNIDLTYEQEELIVDLIATYGQEIIGMTNIIFKRLKNQ